jgi:ATP-binding protein involved in chromosome partitioning
MAEYVVSHGTEVLMSEAAAILEPAATRIRDPISGRSVWMAGLITDSTVDGDTLRFTLALRPQHSKEDEERLKATLLSQIQGLGFDGRVECRVSRTADEVPAAAPKKDPVRGMSGPGMQAHGGPFVKKHIDGVKHVIAVASGKGGVGKSTVSTNLAVALSRSGLSVGLMDADIYGPSLPTMMNVNGKPIANERKKIIPLEAYGIQCMSMGFLVPEKEAIIWRGPMVMGAVRQFIHEVEWGELDVLVIDLPPGTGDAQLTMIQTVPLSGAVVVTTPQKVAVVDAERAITMFRKLEVPVLGIIENMSWLEMPDGSRMHPFGTGGGAATAEAYEVPLIAQIPFDQRICEGGDNGIPAASRGDGPGEAFVRIADAVGRMLQDG